MGKMHAEGVTLIELLVTLAVLAAVLAIGIPAFGDFFANNRMSAAVNDMVSALHLARSEAVKRRSTITLCASSDWQSGSPSCTAANGPEQGWIVFADPNANAVRDAGEAIVDSHGPLPQAIADRISWVDEDGNGATPFYVSFAPTGFRQDLVGLPRCAAHLQLCDDRGDREVTGGVAAGRWIVISPTGRPRILAERAQLQDADNPLGGC
jgi:type IV fimbrial biogenesis protein FimT